MILPPFSHDLGAFFMAADTLGSRRINFIEFIAALPLSFFRHYFCIE